MGEKTKTPARALRVPVVSETVVSGRCAWGRAFVVRPLSSASVCNAVHINHIWQATDFIQDARQLIGAGNF